MASLIGLFAVAWAVTLSGGLIVLGGLGALTADAKISPLVPPYRLAWTTWSLEVVALLVGLYALAVGPFRNWRATVVAFYASLTPILITLTNDVLVAKSGLPGSNGAETRANAVAAGLILVLIGNFTQTILAALHDTEERVAPSSDHGSDKGAIA